MPSLLDGLINQSEIAQLYMYLLKQKVNDQYRGHQDYHLMLKAIDSKIPIVGGEVKVQKEDKNGNFYTVTYHITVKDDLGNFIKTIDDLGGQCMKGEIVKKGYIYSCLKCGEPFCRRHIEFVDNNPKKPLCRYGFLGWEGCYRRYAHKYSAGDEIELKRLEHELKKKRLLEELEGKSTLEGGQEQQALPPPRKKTGLLSRMIHGSVQSRHCGNCDRMISFADIICQNCRNSVDIDIDAPLSCPVCGEPITQVECPNCEAINKL